MTECWLVLRTDDESCVCGPFGSALAAREHMDELGHGREDNARITAGLMIRRFVAAQDLEDTNG